MNADQRPPVSGTSVTTRPRKIVRIAAAGVVVIALAAVLAQFGILLAPRRGQPSASPTAGVAATTATATVAPTPTPPPLTGPQVLMTHMGPPRQVYPLSQAAGTPATASASQLALLAQRPDWRAGLAAGGQPAGLGVPHVASFAVGVTQVPGVIIDPAPIDFGALSDAAAGAIAPLSAGAPEELALCVDGTAEMQLAAGAAAFYNRSGRTLTAPIALTALFGEPASLPDSAGDHVVPVVVAARCFYDVPANVWLAAALVIGFDLDTSQPAGQTHIDLALNRSADPRAAWTVYQLAAAHDGLDGLPAEAGCPCVGDHLLLGADTPAIYLTTDELTRAGAFVGARIYAIDLSGAASGANAVPVAEFTRLSLGGALVASVQPATLVGIPGAEFFMSALDPAGTVDRRLGVWAMTGEQALSHGQPPTLTSAVIGSEPYGRPPAAGTAQKGSATTLAAGDDRLAQVEYRNGQLYTALETAAVPSGDGMARAGVAWFDVQAQLGPGGAVRASVAHQGYIAVRGANLLAPDLGVAADGDMAVVATLVGPGVFPTAVYTTTHPKASSPFGPLQIAAAGGRPASPAGCAAGAACAWTGASASAWDPVGLQAEAVMWMSAAYAPGSGDGTRVFAVGPI